MPGAKIPVLEIEKLKLTKSGGGIDYYNDGTNFLKGRNWSGTPAGSGSFFPKPDSGLAKFLCAASSSGWLKIHMISSSGYGATGQSFYIPVFSNVNTTLSL